MPQIMRGQHGCAARIHDMSNIRPSVAAARENARHRDGTFGEQPHADAGQLNFGTEPEPAPVPEPRTWIVADNQLLVVQTKLAKLRDRATKKGFNGDLRAETEPYTWTEKTAGGREQTMHGHKLRIIGSPARFDGWTFTAAIDRIPAETGDDQFVIRNAPGTSRVDPDTITPGRCDHCGQNRHRNTTYVVEHEDGRHLQVGSSCLADFTGHRVTVPFPPDPSDDIDEWVHGSGGRPGDPDVNDVLIWSAAIVARDGHYRGRNSFDDSTTADDVTNLMWGSAKTRAELEASVADYLDEAEQVAPIMRQTLIDHADDSDYNRNLAAALRGVAVGPKQLGLVCSAPAAYRHIVDADRREQQRAAEKAARPVSQWVGEVGQKTSRPVTVTKISTVAGYMPGSSQTMMVMTDADGNQMVGYTTAGWSDNVNVGDQFTVTGTVKKHDIDYHDNKRTMLSRFKPQT